MNMNILDFMAEEQSLTGIDFLALKLKDYAVGLLPALQAAMFENETIRQIRQVNAVVERNIKVVFSIKRVSLTTNPSVIPFSVERLNH
jgi:hypothetical protein